MTDEEIKARFPGVKFLHCEVFSQIGWGVEWKGQRNAWLFDDTPENNAAVRDKAAAWLATLAN
jgi:hypothetical protein